MGKTVSSVAISPDISDFADRLRALPPDLTEADVLRPELRLWGDERLSIYFTPLPRPRLGTARILLVGLTPGRHQHWRATLAASEALRSGSTPEEASEAARVGSFAGPLRANLVRMLDGIGLADALEIESTASLWMADRHLQASTSAIRHAVFLAGTEANYSGSPRINRHPMLSAYVDEVLVQDVAASPDALVIPLGAAVQEGLARLRLDPQRVLTGFPHPSGGNGHRARQYAERKDALTAVVSAWE